MPYQATFEQRVDGTITRTTGCVDTKVQVGDLARIKGQEGWWAVVRVHQLPWVPVSKWKVGGL